MRILAKILVAGLALGACGPLSLYYRPGVSVSRMQTDQTNCEVQALRDAPVASQIRQRPPVYFPGQRYCNAAGACYFSPGYWIDGGIYTVDPNQDLRDRVTAQCMAQKGYQPVSLPPCPAGMRTTTPAQTQVLPALASNSCVIRLDGGGWQIVTPGIASKS